MKKILCYLWILALAWTPVLQAKKGDHGSDKGDKKEWHGHDHEGNNHEDKGKSSHEKDDKDRDDHKGKHFITPVEREVIHDYVVVYQQKENVKSLPPGLAKKVARGETLPPGWQKKIIQGEVLPPLVYAEVVPVPNVILVKLPEQPAGTRLVVLDGRVLRIADATRTILDVFDIR